VVLDISGYKLSINQLPPPLQSLSDVSLSERPADYFWKSLKSAGVRLKRLTMRDLDSWTIEYLCSYSGLEYLSAQITDKSDDQTAETFFTTALRHHADRIKELVIRVSSLVKSWYFHQKYASAISSCTKLGRFSLHFGRTDVVSFCYSPQWSGLMSLHLGRQKDAR
jgi:hypothetical protein